MACTLCGPGKNSDLVWLIREPVTEFCRALCLFKIATGKHSSGKRGWRWLDPRI